MTRLQRLCLDAVERCGSPYLASLHVFDYVKRRRWMVSLARVHDALWLLQQMGYLDSQSIAGTDVRGYYPKRVYKRTSQVDHGENVALAPRNQLGTS